MMVKPDLSMSFCIHAVVSAAPYPSTYQPGSASTATLFDLGVVDAVTQGHFVSSVKSRIYPWLIDNAVITSTPDTTVQVAAASVMNNAK